MFNNFCNNIDEGIPKALLNSEFSPGDGPIFLDRLACSGDEKNLIDCRRNSVLGRSDCSHEFEAGVRCPGKNLSNYIAMCAQGMK